jgi:hypothetical protein
MSATQDPQTLESSNDHKQGQTATRKQNNNSKKNKDNKMRACLRRFDENSPTTTRTTTKLAGIDSEIDVPQNFFNKQRKRNESAEQTLLKKSETNKQTKLRPPTRG